MYSVSKNMRGSVGVHAAHCCKWHGCKYGDKDCPVVTGEVEQHYLCEDCDYVLENEEYYRNRVSQAEEIKRWREEHKCK
jgi:hypothetical protein